MDAGKTVPVQEAFISDSALRILESADLVLADASFLMWRHWSPADEAFRSSSAFDAERYASDRESQKQAANHLFRILPEVLRQAGKSITVHPDVREQMSSLQRKHFQAGTEKGRNAEAAAATGALRLSRLSRQGLLRECPAKPAVTMPLCHFKRQPWIGHVISAALETQEERGPLQVVVLTQDHSLAGEIARKQSQITRSAFGTPVIFQTLCFDYNQNTLVPREDLGKPQMRPVGPGAVKKGTTRTGTWSLLDHIEHWAFVAATMAAIFIPFLLLPQSSVATSPPLASFFVKSVRFDPLTGNPLIYDSPIHPEITIRIDMGSAALNLAADMTGLRELHWERFRLVPELGSIALAMSAHGESLPPVDHSRGVTFVPWPETVDSAPASSGWSLSIRSRPQ